MAMRSIATKSNPAGSRARVLRSFLLFATLGLPALAAPLTVQARTSNAPRVLSRRDETGTHAAAFASDGSLSWDTSVTSLPTPLVYPAATRGQDGNIYVFGGANPAMAASNVTYIYHPHSNSWSQGATMPTAREAPQAVTLADGRIIVMGGTPDCGSSQYGCTVYNSADIYNPRTDTWAAAAPMQTARERFAAVLANDGLVYAMGGWDGNHALASVEVYNPATNRWNYSTSLPQAEEGLAAAVAPDGRVIAMGGFDGHSEDPSTATYYGNVYVYTSGAWTNGTPMPTPREDLAVAVGLDGRVYAIGGFKSDGWVSVAEVYDPSSNSWSSIAPLPGATQPVRCCLAAATAPDGRIFAFGGNGPITQVDVYAGPSPVVGLVPSSLDFGSQGLDAASPTKSAYVVNDGTAPLTIHQVAIVGPDAADFSESDTCAGATVAPNNGCGIYMIFKPTGPGPRTASVTIVDNASDSPQSIALSGDGLTPPSTPSDTATTTGASSPTATSTASPSATTASTVATTNTPAPSATQSNTSTPSPSATFSATNTPMPSATSTATNMSTPSSTPSATNTPTPSPTPSVTNTPTPSPIPSATSAPSSAPTATALTTSTPVQIGTTASTQSRFGVVAPSQTAVVRTVVVNHTIVQVVRVPVFVVTQRRVSSGSMLTVRVRAVPHARLLVTLQAAKKRLASASGQTNNKGAFVAHLRITYNPSKATNALMRVALRTILHKRTATTVRVIHVVVLPRPRAHPRHKR